MGFWGVRPYENDDAADWFRNLWEDLPLPKTVEETLDLDVDRHHAQIRAAIHVLLMLGDTYQWPIDDIDRHSQLAITRLEEILELEFYKDDEFQNQIREEIEILKARMGSVAQESTRSTTTERRRRRTSHSHAPKRRSMLARQTQRTRKLRP